MTNDDEFIAIIDQHLKDLAGRKLASTDEVADILLDLRSLMVNRKELTDA